MHLCVSALETKPVRSLRLLKACCTEVVRKIFRCHENILVRDITEPTIYIAIWGHIADLQWRQENAALMMWTGNNETDRFRLIAVKDVFTEVIYTEGAFTSLKAFSICLNPPRRHQQQIRQVRSDAEASADCNASSDKDSFGKGTPAS
jgi:hypothetical protein